MTATIPHAAMSAIAAASNPCLQGAYSSRRQGIHGYSVDYALDRVKQMGAVVNQALTIRSSQVFAPKDIPRLLDHATRGEVDPSFMINHKLSLEDALKSSELWRMKTVAYGRCLRRSLAGY